MPKYEKLGIAIWHVLLIKMFYKLETQLLILEDIWGFKLNKIVKSFS